MFGVITFIRSPGNQQKPGDVKVGNMSKSAKGTSEQHGRNVRAKSGLNRSILDHGWYEMRRQLEYKPFACYTSGIYQPAVRLLWSYGERKPSNAK